MSSECSGVFHNQINRKVFPSYSKLYGYTLPCTVCYNKYSILEYSKKFITRKHQILKIGMRYSKYIFLEAIVSNLFFKILYTV